MFKPPGSRHFYNTAGTSQADPPAEKEVERAERDLKMALSRVTKLCCDRGRTAALKFARSNQQHSLSAAGDEFDRNPWLFACENCVIDLRTGEPVDARPDQLLSKGSPVEWRGITAPAPTWERFITDTLEGSAANIGFLQRFFGYALTGDTRHHLMVIFEGIGRNGKGTILEVLKHVMGDLAGPIQSEMLLDPGRSRSASAPSPDIMMLRGLRLAYGSETDRGARFSTARVKWLTGADTLVGRWPHDRRPVTFRPSHKLVLLTNSRPPAPPEDFAFWERVVLIPFRLSYVTRAPEHPNEKKADLSLPQKLADEAPGILAWLVRGCLEWQRIGLEIPDTLRNATAEYRLDDDFISEWIEQRCVLSPGAITRSGVLYDDFEGWFSKGWASKVPSHIRFAKMLQGRFIKERDADNYPIFMGIRLRAD